MAKKGKVEINIKTDGKNWKWKDHEHMHDHGFCWHHGGRMGGAYCLGIIGAAIYYIQQATGFWAGVLGVLKALVWPAFIVYKLLGM